jgi:small-conductance mechanosensitive channel
VTAPLFELLLQSAARQWLASLGVPLLLVLIVATAAAAAYTLERIVLAMLRGWARRTKNQFDDVLVNAMHPPLMIVTFLAAIGLALRLIPLGLSPFVLGLVRNVGLTLLIIAVGLAGVKLVTGMMKMPARRNPRWFPLSTVGSRLAAAVLWVVIFVTVLHQYGIEVTPIVTTLGVATIGVTLALQTTMQNFFAGLWIQAGENLRPGHFIRLEGHQLDGFIEEVGWRTTRIRTLPGNMVVVPNHELSQAIITNFSLPADKMGTSITIVAGFESEPEHVVAILLEEAKAMAKQVDYVLEDPAPAARLNKRVDNGWEFWCGFWVAHYWDQWNGQGLMFKRVRDRFLKEGIRLALPIHEEYAVPEDRIDVRRSIVSARTTNGNGQATTTTSRTGELPAEGETD